MSLVKDHTSWSSIYGSNNHFLQSLIIESVGIEEKNTKPATDKRMITAHRLTFL